MSETSIERTQMRSRMVGGLRASHEGCEVTLAGWVHRRRDLGGLLFIDLRDRSGLVQVSFGPDWTEKASLECAHGLGHEDVIQVKGDVVLRPQGAHNPDMGTGEIEIHAKSVELFSNAQTPVIPVYRGPEDELPTEELRLKHRVLDLRRSEIQDALFMRHELVLATRNYLAACGFMEVETPILTKATPEGARDYLVPSRVHHGEFYALPQSPQIYKQILMVSGFDRYFQIARCFRDEDLRSDRQPEFTQIDVEASFIEPEDIFFWIEGLMVCLANTAGIDISQPFPRLTWAEAMERYGSDRPDLRYQLEITDWTQATSSLGFNMIDSAVEKGARVRGLRLAGGAKLSRRQIADIESKAKEAGAPGLLWAKQADGEASGPLGKFLAPENSLAMGLSPGDIAFVAFGPDSLTSPVLDAVRSESIEALELTPQQEHSWLWVTDFPVFDLSDGDITPSHHPFVMPHPDDLELLESDPSSVRGTAYDLVYNGNELGSGSIRVHQSELQRRILRALGLGDDEIEQKFGFLLRALSAGAPPHGGIALGMDRIVQRFSGSESLRDVIAFPKTTAARALYEEAPTSVGNEELSELGLTTLKSSEG